MGDSRSPGPDLRPEASAGATRELAQREDVTRRDALASSIAMLLGGFSLAELERIDLEVRAIVEERHTWARHEGATKWCLVERYEPGHLKTACRGGWSTSDVWESESRPAIADRCAACQRAFRRRSLGKAIEQAALIEDGLRELRDAEVTEPRPRPSVADFDISEES